MTATTLAPATVRPPAAHARSTGRSPTRRPIAWRNLVTMRGLPQLLVFSTIQPVIFVLMFRYVFGGAIQIPGAFPTSTT